MSRLAILLLVPGCWTGPTPPASRQEPPVNLTLPATAGYRATLRMEAASAARKFQGAWLELAAGQRWIIDDRATELWRSFDNAAVIVHGHCYEPSGQAIQGPSRIDQCRSAAKQGSASPCGEGPPSGGPHFQVERMRFASPPDRSTPLVEVGPEVVLRGQLRKDPWPAGSKLAGTTHDSFVADGVAYAIAGSPDLTLVPSDTPATVLARRVKPDPAYAAGPGGEQIWIVSVHDADYVDAHAGKPVPCPAN